MPRFSVPGESQGNSALRSAAVPRQNHHLDPHTADRGTPGRPDARAGAHRRPERRRGKKKWLLVPVAAVAAALTGGIAAAATGFGGVQFKVASPITVQALGVNVSNAGVGQTVTAGAKVVAESQTTLSEVAIAVKAPDGTRVDFPHATHWAIGTTQKVFIRSKAFNQTGTYTYWFAYKKNGHWTNLNPHQTFTVGGPSTTPPSTPGTPSSTPSTTPSSTPSSTPTAGSTASPSTGPTTGPTQPAGSAKPDASNTGVVPGTALTVVTGNQTFSTSGQVITGKDFHGYVKVTGSNITFKNCIFRGGTPSGNNALLNTEAGNNTVVEDSEFVPLQPAATIDGVWTANTKLYRVNIHGSVDGMKAGNNTLVQDSYIHDMSWFASDPNQGGGSTHNDGVQAFDGVSGVTLRHNNIDMSTTKDGNAALQDSASNVTVDNNWLDGGGCTLNFADHGHNLPALVVTNNRFGRHSFYQCPILLSNLLSLAQNSGNVWADTGTPIPAPQQHD